MSKRDKRLQKFGRIRWMSHWMTSIVLMAEGFELDHATGSHHIYRAIAAGEVFRVVIPFARPVKVIYVRQALVAIDRRRELLNEADTEAEDKIRPKLLPPITL